MIEPREAVGGGTGSVLVVDVAGGSVVGGVSTPDVAGVAVLAVDDLGTVDERGAVTVRVAVVVTTNAVPARAAAVCESGTVGGICGEAWPQPASSNATMPAKHVAVPKLALRAGLHRIARRTLPRGFVTSKTLATRVPAGVIRTIGFLANSGRSDVTRAEVIGQIRLYAEGDVRCRPPTAL